MLRRLLISAAFSVVPVMAWASSAQASAAADCVIQGAAQADVQLVGGSGTFGFAPFTAVCVAANTAPAPGAGVVTLSITSNGTFTNTVCGTGHMEDTDPTVDATVTAAWVAVGPIAPSAAAAEAKLEASNLAYQIDFVAGVGDLRWLSPTVTGGGAIVIGPDPGRPASDPPPNGGGCTDGIQVVGNVSGVIV